MSPATVLMTATTIATTPLSVPVFGNSGCFGVGGTSVVTGGSSVVVTGGSSVVVTGGSSVVVTGGSSVVVTGGSSVVVVGGVYVFWKAFSYGYATEAT